MKVFSYIVIISVFNFLKLVNGLMTIIVDYEKELMKPPLSSHNTRQRSVFQSVEHHENETCNAVKGAIKEMERESMCQPRETFVHLVNPLGHAIGEVVLKKCQGRSKGNLKCAASETREKKVYVKEITNKVTCKSIKVKEDVKCKVMCVPLQCEKDKVFDHNACSCKCKMSPVKCTGKKLYNHNSCQCECPFARKCTSGSIWLESECRCEKIVRHKRKPRIS